MFWNYRIINMKSENGGEDWYCIREVYYGDKKELEGHSDISIGSESLEDLGNVLSMMGKALKLPVLQEGDFNNGEKRGFSEFSEFMQYCINNDVTGL